MTVAQRFFAAILPRRLADALVAESNAWRIRCRTCGAEQSYWDAGGIRLKAASTRKLIGGWCSRCNARRSFERYRALG